MPEFTMPSLGADMDEGTLTEWLVHEGDTVRRGDVVAVVDTAKSAIEVECFDSGTVTDLLVSPGQTVPVGTPMAVISSTEERPLPKAETPPATETTPKGPAAKAATGGTDHVGPEPSVPVEDASATSSPLVRHLADELGVPLGAVQGSGPGGRVTRADVREAAHTDARPDVSGRRRPAASPLARRLARELGVDLNSVHGSGKNGVIRADDVRAAAHPEPPPGTATAAEHVEEPGRVRAPEADGAATMRSAIAGLMSRAKREIPHYYLATTTDVARAVEWTHAYNRGRPVGEHVLPTALLLKAVAVAARQVPELNGFWVDDRFEPASAVRLAVAVSLRGGGLLAPVLDGADRMHVAELMARLRDVVGRARSGRLRGSETTGPTITVTNLGDQGAEAVFGVIYPPQVALVGLGRITERPVAVDGLLGVHPVVTVTLSADHRATDGATGSRFLAAFDRLIKNPEDLS